MRRFALFLLCALLSAGPVAAGAWLREEGTGFLSFSQTVGENRDEDYNALFLEYGLTPNTTLGLDAGMGKGLENWQAILFLRRPVGATDGASRRAVELGLGLSGSAPPLTALPSDLSPLLRPGLSWGRGLDTRWGNGWVGVETLAELRLNSGDVALKADTTLGLKRSGGAMMILQFQAGDYPGADPYLRLAPSYVQPLGSRLHLELGVVAGVAGDDAARIKLGTWLAF